MSAENFDDIQFRLDTEIRRKRAAFKSDMDHLRDTLHSAADRFSDVADLLEKPDPDIRHLAAFLRRSAERYVREASIIS